MSFDTIKKQVSGYYTGKVKQFGATPRGVDWNSIESQELRFSILKSIIDPNVKKKSILDYGCGFGYMYAYMKKTDKNFQYTGFDISEAMLLEAKKLYKGKDAQWISSVSAKQKFDYVIASGIFNVRLESSKKDWEKYMLHTLDAMNRCSEKGFSFNVLTKYSDKEYTKDYLYYADPLFLFDYCKKNYSKYVTLLHDYPLYEFTILVKKSI